MELAADEVTAAVSLPRAAMGAEVVVVMAVEWQRSPWGLRWQVETLNGGGPVAVWDGRAPEFQMRCTSCHTRGRPVVQSDSFVFFTAVGQCIFPITRGTEESRSSRAPHFLSPESDHLLRFPRPHLAEGLDVHDALIPTGLRINSARPSTI